MEIDFSSQPDALPQPPTSMQPFGLVIPGTPVRTDFIPVDGTGLKYSLALHCPGDVHQPLASVSEIVFFLLPNVPLQPDQGVLCYWQITAAVATGPGQDPPSTGFELLGSLTAERPSAVFHTGWSEHEQVVEISTLGTPVVVTIGVSVEPLTNLQNMGVAADPLQGRLFSAQRIAQDLFQFMLSFDTGEATSTGGSRYSSNMMVVPKNIFDRWFQRFEARFQRDPNFFLKSNMD